MDDVILHLKSDIEATIDLYVSYMIKGFDHDPDEITALLQIEPSFVRKKNLKGPPWNLWDFSSKGFVQSNYVDEHLLFLLETLEEKEKIIGQLRENLNVSIHCRIVRKSEGGFGQLDIPTDLLIRISKLCQFVIMDHFCVIEDE